MSEQIYEQDGYLRYGNPGLQFDERGRLRLGEPWPAQHVRCVLDAHGQFRRKHEVLRCALCLLWWDVFEMSKAGGQHRLNKRGSYCRTCYRNYHAWRKQREYMSMVTKRYLDKSLILFRQLYTTGATGISPPVQQPPQL